MKSSGVWTQNKITPSLTSNQGQIAKHTTVKWAFAENHKLNIFVHANKLNTGEMWVRLEVHF